MAMATCTTPSHHNASDCRKAYAPPTGQCAGHHIDHVHARQGNDAQRHQAEQPQVLGVGDEKTDHVFLLGNRVGHHRRCDAATVGEYADNKCPH